MENLIVKVNPLQIKEKTL